MNLPPPTSSSVSRSPFSSRAPFPSWTDLVQRLPRSHNQTFSPWFGANQNDKIGLTKSPLPTTNGGGRKRTAKEAWDLVLQWEAKAAKEGLGTRVLCGDSCDWLDLEVPVALRVALLRLIKNTPHLTWLLPTRHPDAWESLISAALDDIQYNGSLGSSDLVAWLRGWLEGRAPANIWIGAIIRDPAKLAPRMDALHHIPAARRFVVAIPTEGPLDLQPWLQGFCMTCKRPRTEVERHFDPQTGYLTEKPSGMSECRFCGPPYQDEAWTEHYTHGFQWVICQSDGGPMNPAWVRALRDACAHAKIPFFFTGWGTWVGATLIRDQNRMLLHNEWSVAANSAHLEVKEWPDKASSCPAVAEVSVRLRSSIATPAQQSAWRETNNKLLDSIEHLAVPMRPVREQSVAAKPPADTRRTTNAPWPS